MPTTTTDGIDTHYEVLGSGPPLLMFSPGGFDATMDKWRTQSIYAKIRLLDHLPNAYTCIVFDRRETGGSGGRVERITWQSYVAQGKGLLDHLGITQAHVMGACMGCCAAAVFGTTYPDATKSLTLYWPVGGPLYRINGHNRFAKHVAYVDSHGLDGVVELVKTLPKSPSFGEDPRQGPWANVIRRDESFREAYVRQDPAQYRTLVTAIARTLIDRDTVPGPEPEDLLRLTTPAFIVPGRDTGHARSAAYYLHECLRNSVYWNIEVEDQSESNVPARILEFLASGS